MQVKFGAVHRMLVSCVRVLDGNPLIAGAMSDEKPHKNATPQGRATEHIRERWLHSTYL